MAENRLVWSSSMAISGKTDLHQSNGSQNAQNDLQPPFFKRTLRPFRHIRSIQIKVDISVNTVRVLKTVSKYEIVYHFKEY